MPGALLPLTMNCSPAVWLYSCALFVAVLQQQAVRLQHTFVLSDSLSDTAYL